jgi:hypothetical protein
MLENKKTQEKVSAHSWRFMRLRIRKSHLSIGCGGGGRAALPIISDYVNQINEIAIKAEYLKEPCILDDDGGYLNIMNLTGFTTQAGWMLIGMLLKDGWFIQAYRNDEYHDYHDMKKETWTEPLIDMLKKSDFD